MKKAAAVKPTPYIIHAILSGLIRSEEVKDLTPLYGLEADLPLISSLLAKILVPDETNDWVIPNLDYCLKRLPNETPKSFEEALLSFTYLLMATAHLKKRDHPFNLINQGIKDARSLLKILAEVEDSEEGMVMHKLSSNLEVWVYILSLPLSTSVTFRT